MRPDESQVSVVVGFKNLTFIITSYSSPVLNPPIFKLCSVHGQPSPFSTTAPSQRHSPVFTPTFRTTLTQWCLGSAAHSHSLHSMDFADKYVHKPTIPEGPRLHATRKRPDLTSSNKTNPPPFRARSMPDFGTSAPLHSSRPRRQRQSARSRSKNDDTAAKKVRSSHSNCASSISPAVACTA